MRKIKAVKTPFRTVKLGCYMMGDYINGGLIDPEYVPADMKVDKDTEIITNILYDPKESVFEIYFGGKLRLTIRTTEYCIEWENS
jgi:hypothetical protein